MRGHDLSRIHLIDNLRGAALIGILLLHGVQHFDLISFPAGGPVWLQIGDQWVSHAVFLLLWGKAYAVFAMLFGVSYHIQEQNNRSRGIGHRSRMLRRMTVLFGFGVLHGMFYAGDILCILALFGILLTVLGTLPTRVLITIAFLLSVQPQLLVPALQHQHAPFQIGTEDLVQRSFLVLRDGSLGSVMAHNLWSNRFAEWSTMLGEGKFFQMAAWMLLGIVAGRTGYFAHPLGTAGLNSRILMVAIVTLALLGFLHADQGSAWVTLAISWKASLMVVIYISATMLLAARWRMINTPTIISGYGRMSLTNYVGQGVLGSILFYGYGFGLCRWGPTLSIAVALGILAAQLMFTRWWAAQHRRGPLEELWARLAN